MNCFDRVKRAINFNNPDRIPLMHAILPSAWLKYGDKLFEIIRKYPVKYLLEKKSQTSYAARDRGIVGAKGEILAFTDGDCVASNVWLKEAIIYFDRSEVGCVAGKIKAYRLETELEKYLDRKDIFSVNRAHFLPFALTANVIYRKSVFDICGLFDETMISGGDADFCWRMQLNTKFKMVYAKPAVVFHQHPISFGTWLRRHIRYGYGFVYLRTKYKRYFPKNNLFKEIFWLTLGVFTSLRKLLSRKEIVPGWKDGSPHLVGAVYEAVS